jgi:hypothetical protein
MIQTGKYCNSLSSCIRNRILPLSTTAFLFGFSGTPLSGLLAGGNPTVVPAGNGAIPPPEHRDPPARVRGRLPAALGR